VYSRGIFLMAWLMSLVLVPLGRSACRRLLARCRWWGQAVVIFGAGKAGHMVVGALRRHPELGLNPLAVLDDDPATHQAIEGVPVLGKTELGAQLARQAGIRYAIVAMPGVPRDRLLPLIERFSRDFSHLLVIPDLFGMASLWVSAKDLGGVLGLELREHLALPGPRVVKRAMDLALTLVGGLVILPFLLLLAVLIKLDSRGPIIFRQERLGQDGRRFKALKFRTMYQDAESRLAEVLDSDPALRQEYETYHKLRQDPRVTRFGRFLRKFSLDEFPQLWNVLQGEMSLVGPRAYMPDERHYMGHADVVILRALPGISGLWQVSGRNELSFAERVALDVYYVRNWSPWFDIHLLARTIWVVLFAKGAY
jgi:Undecaprenyl-phosphate galactose phosphotransferase WbaP